MPARFAGLAAQRADGCGSFLCGKAPTWGDPAGLELIGAFRQANVETAELPGGAEGLGFLVFGKGNSKPDRFLLDYSRALTERAMGSTKTSFLEMQLLLRNYFQQVAALTALGSRRGERVEITLTLNDKAGRQRTERVFKILGIKLTHGRAGFKIESAEGKSQAKKQDVLAALAVDEEAIQDALATGKTYVLEIPMDRVPAFPAESFWRAGFFEHQQYAGGLAEAFLADARLPKLYLALNSMDRGAAQVLLQTMPLGKLEEKYSTELSQFSTALAMSGTNAEVPGGQRAYEVWQSLTGASPANAGAFFQALLGHDQGRLIAFFYTLSQLDITHQRFFTRSSERAKRFYDVFRESGEAQRGLEHGMVTSAFLEFLREVPLNEDASVDFPGGPEVWMVAKGAHSSTSAIAKLSKRARRIATPEDEDTILIRLASTAYKAESQEQSELSNFIAVTRIDAQRTSALSPDSALLLAQNYSTFGALYPYFAALNGLEAQDFQKLFSVAGKIEGLDAVTANIRLGQLHAFLALLCAAAQSGILDEKMIQQLYRSSLDRYSGAQGSPEWTSVLLANLDDLGRLAGQRRGNFAKPRSRCCWSGTATRQVNATKRFGRYSNYRRCRRSMDCWRSEID